MRSSQCTEGQARRRDVRRVEPAVLTTRPIRRVELRREDVDLDCGERSIRCQELEALPIDDSLVEHRLDVNARSERTSSSLGQ